MNRVAKLVGLGSLLVFAGCSSQSTPQATSNTPSDSSKTAALPPPQTFPSPTVSAKSKLPEAPVMAKVAVPGLLSATKPETLAATTLSNSQRDPFAALPPATPTIQLAPGTLKSLFPSAAPAKQPAASAPKSLPAKARSLPQAPRIALKPMPVPAVIPVEPTLPSAPPSPPPSLTDLADAIEISGVVQVGSRVMAIVKAPDEGSARYVQAGDYLAGGKVLLKAIRMGNQGEPTIFLEQNGRTVTKFVSGSSNRMASVLGS